jgi:hypothetical protein
MESSPQWQWWWRTAWFWATHKLGWLPARARRRRIYGITIPSGYRDWKLISVNHLTGKFNQLRAQVGNDIAFKIFRMAAAALHRGVVEPCPFRLEAIEGAKKPETRARRIALAVKSVTSSASARGSARRP